LSERLPNEKLDKGLIIFAGIDEYDDEILEIIQPELKIKMFYYSCASKFVVDAAREYISSYTGNIVFASGDMCLIYQYDKGTFMIYKNITANLQKRQKKGGQSALRIARLAEETRHKYVTKIIDYLNKLNREDKTLLFGSKEITKMIQENKTILQPIIYKGFLEFNTSTILDTKKWCRLLNENDCDVHNEYYSNILEYLETDVDRLDFDKLNKNEMKYYLGDDSIPFPTKENQYYTQLCVFEYIGVKYYSYEI
jgi:hypothetical protein